MKTRIHLGLFLMIAMLFASEVKAQAQISVVIGSPMPVYAPVYGPAVHARYIYYPEYNFYFDTFRNVYIVADHRGWVYVNRLPRHYRHVNLHRARFVHIDMRHDHPHRYNQQHVRNYGPRNHPGNNRGNGQKHNNGRNQGPPHRR